jgi:uncharacterized RDD family membrane protein YckC
MSDAPDDRSANAMTPGFIEPTFGQRLVARVLDTLVVLPALLLVGAMVDGGARVVLGMLIAGTYEVTLVARRGQTLGKRAMRTHIVDRASGGAPSIRQAFARWLVVGLGSVAALVLPSARPFEVVYTLVVLLPVLRPPLHRGLHDLAASTIVSSDKLVSLDG